MFLVSSYSCLNPIRWSQVLSQEWRYSWSSTERRCSNFIRVINNFIDYLGVAYIRGFRVPCVFHSYEWDMQPENSCGGCQLCSPWSRFLLIGCSMSTCGYNGIIVIVIFMSLHSVSFLATLHIICIYWKVCWVQINDLSIFNNSILHLKIYL